MVINNMDKMCVRLSELHILANTIVTKSVGKSLDAFMLCVITPPAQILPTRASQILSQNL